MKKTKVAMRTPGKRTTIFLGIAAAGVLLAAGIVLWNPLWEAWWLRQLDSEDEETAQKAATRLGEMRSRRGIEFLHERIVKEDPKAILLLLPLNTPGQTTNPNVERFNPERRITELLSRTCNAVGTEQRLEMAFAILRAKKSWIRVRVAVAQSLNKPPPDKKIPPDPERLAVSTWKEGLLSDDLLSRAGAVYGLSLVGKDDPEAIAALEEAARDPSISAHAKVALRKLRERPEDRVVDPSYKEKEEAGVLETAFQVGLTDEPNPVSDQYALSFSREGSKTKLPPTDTILKKLSGLEMVFHGVKRSIKVTAIDPEKTEDTQGGGAPECRVTILKWISKFEVEFEVSIYGGPLAGSGFNAKVIKTDTGRVVSPGSITERWIS